MINRKTKIIPFLQKALGRKDSPIAVVPYQRRPIQRPVTVIPAAAPEPTVITAAPPRYKLSQLILLGRQQHPQAVGSFVEIKSSGYYAHERREEISTCALAAAYVGAFGPNAINERTGQSMVNAGLEPLIGYHPDKLTITGPAVPVNGGITHQVGSLSSTIQNLNDKHGWTRLAIAHWLAQQGL